MSSQQDLEFTLKDFTQIFEHARFRLLAICIELEKTKLTISPDNRRVIGKYLICIEAYTLPWMAFCAGLLVSINPPLSKHPLVTQATLVQAMSMLIAQQLATIRTKAREEGEYPLKMLEDKILEAKMVAATMLRMDTALGDDVLQAITVSNKLVKYLKKRGHGIKAGLSS
ncbi:hypothetical protein C8R48DRAFT_774769 [Suillus tomentosus]|nr:hypothetical protein C8R48DRAFT_774769 [Suillus tomentosus]